MKVAIIGCGNIGSKRAIAISKNKKTKIEYIVGRKKNYKKDYLANIIAKKLNITYSTDRAKVISSKIDSVILSTQPDLFLTIGKEILKQKNIY